MLAPSIATPDIRPLRASRADRAVEIADQTRLPGEWRFVTLRYAREAAVAISTMQVRGAPLIGATAAYGLALALHADPSDIALRDGYALLLATRPTAVNLRWALDRVEGGDPAADSSRADAAWSRGRRDRRRRRRDQYRHRRHGARAHRASGFRRPRTRSQVMTHCNAGALATLGWGTATAPLFLAHARRWPSTSG